ncbi:MAG TPA: peptidase M50 [Acidobacteria bacterium]|nr:peptidase M50 [Acidobacteriota bacterium]
MIPRDDPVPRPAERPALSARTMLLVSGGITLALFVLPFGGVIARPFVLLSTLAHELGHGLTGMLLGGGFRRLEMWPSGAGVTEIDLAGFGRLRQALTLAGGLVGPAVASALCFALGRTSRGARACLLGIGLLLGLVEILVVRNLFGLIFTALVAAACLLLALRGTPAAAQLALVFVAVQLALSVFSRADYLFTRVAGNPNGLFPSDVEHMARLLWLPYWFWGVLCGAFSLAVLGWGLRMYWRR